MEPLVSENGFFIEDVLEVIREDYLNNHVPKEITRRLDSLHEKHIKCGICHSTTMGFFFYGAIACNACRVFFKRAVLSKKKIVCQGKGSCFHKCRKCRFERCLQAGMQPSLVLKKQKDILDNIAPVVDPVFTLEDEIWLQGLWSGTMALTAQCMVSFLKSFQPLLDQLFHGKANGSMFLADPAFEDHATSHLVDYYIQLPEFQNWPIDKAKQVIEEKMPLANELCLAQMVHSPILVYILVNEFAAWLHREGENKELLNLINNKLSNGDPVTLAYDQIYPNIQPKARSQHQAIVSKLGKWPIDIISCILQHMIVMFSSDKGARNKYMKLFHLYLRTKRTALQSYSDEVLKEMATTPEVLRKMREMRLTNHPP